MVDEPKVWHYVDVVRFYHDSVAGLSAVRMETSYSGRGMDRIEIKWPDGRKRVFVSKGNFEFVEKVEDGN